MKSQRQFTRRMLLGGGGAWLATRSGEGQESHLKGASFRVKVMLHDCEIDKLTRADLELGVSNIFSFFRDRFHMEDPVPFEVKIIFYADRNAFVAETGAFGAGAFYKPSTKTITAFWRRGNRRQTVETLLHEVSHCVQDTGTSLEPLCISEGLAEYFSMSRASGTNVVIKPHSEHLKILRKMEREEKLPALREHFQLRLPEWQRQQVAGNYYSIAWSLAATLMATNTGKETVGSLLRWSRHYKRKTNMADWAKGIDKVYPGGLKRFEGDWKRFIKGQVRSQTYPSDVRKRAKFEIINV